MPTRRIPVTTPDYTNPNDSDPGVNTAEFVFVRFTHKIADASTADRFDFTMSDPAAENEPLMVDNLVRRSLTVSDPNNPFQINAETGHNLGISHEHEPLAAITHPKLIILDEPTAQPLTFDLETF